MCAKWSHGLTGWLSGAYGMWDGNVGSSQFATAHVFPLTFVSAQHIVIMYHEEGARGIPFPKFGPFFR